MENYRYSSFLIRINLKSYSEESVAWHILGDACAGEQQRKSTMQAEQFGETLLGSTLRALNIIGALGGYKNSFLLPGFRSSFSLERQGDGSNLVPLVNPKIAGKWMFIPLKMYL